MQVSKEVENFIKSMDWLDEVENSAVVFDDDRAVEDLETSTSEEVEDIIF